MYLPARKRAPRAVTTYRTSAGRAHVQTKCAMRAAAPKPGAFSHPAANLAHVELIPARQNLRLPASGAIQSRHTTVSVVKSYAMRTFVQKQIEFGRTNVDHAAVRTPPFKKNLWAVSRSNLVSAIALLKFATSLAVLRQVESSRMIV